MVLAINLRSGGGTLDLRKAVGQVRLQHLIGLIKPDEGTLRSTAIPQSLEKELLKVRHIVSVSGRRCMTAMVLKRPSLREHTRRSRGDQALTSWNFKTVGLEG